MSLIFVIHKTCISFVLIISHYSHSYCSSYFYYFLNLNCVLLQFFSNIFPTIRLCICEYMKMYLRKDSRSL